MSSSQCNQDVPDPEQCRDCGRFNIKLWLAGSPGYCESCLKRQHENQRRREDQEEASRQRQHEREMANQQREETATRLQHEKEEAERQRQFAEQEKVQELEIENRKAAQEESKFKQEDSKLKQERIKAKTIEVQNAQQIEIERLKVQQEDARKKAQQEHTKVRMKEIELEALKERNVTMLREKEINLERFKEETKQEAMAFEVERVKHEEIEMLSGCNLQQLFVINQILQRQSQLEDEIGPTGRSKQGTTSQSRLATTIRQINNGTGSI